MVYLLKAPSENYPRNQKPEEVAKFTIKVIPQRPQLHRSVTAHLHVSAIIKPNNMCSPFGHCSSSHLIDKILRVPNPRREISSTGRVVLSTTIESEDLK